MSRRLIVRWRSLPLADRVALALLGSLMLVTLAARVTWVLTAKMPVPIDDAAGYDASARRLLDTGTYAYPRRFWAKDATVPEANYRRFLAASPDAWTTPGYPVFLASIYKVTGTGEGRWEAARVVQCFLSILTLALAFLIGRRLRGPWAGLLAAVLLALYLPNTWGLGYIYTETLYTLLLTLTVYLTFIAIEKRTLPWAVAVAIATAAAGYVRPIGLLWPVFIVVYMLLSKEFTLRDTVRLTGVAAAVIVLLLAPWWVRNYRLYHRFIPFSTAATNPLYVGTSTSYEAGGRPVDGHPKAMTDELQLMDWWGREGRARIVERLRDRPGWLIANRLARAHAALVRWWPDDPATVKARPALQAWEVFYHPFLLALAGIGIVLGLRDPRLLLLTSLPVYYVALYAATLVLARYVQPMVPVYCVLGATGLVASAAWATRLLRGSAASTLPVRAR